jgi:hypothetical protein
MDHCVTKCFAVPCAGQTILCTPGVSCFVDCTGDAACVNTKVVCPAEHACRVWCDAAQGCAGLEVLCAQDGLCELFCSMNGDSCAGAKVVCGANGCNAICMGTSKPALNCGNSCGCNPCP